MARSHKVKFVPITFNEVTSILLHLQTESWLGNSLPELQGGMHHEKNMGAAANKSLFLRRAGFFQMAATGLLELAGQCNKHVNQTDKNSAKGHPSPNMARSSFTICHEPSLEDL